MKPKQCEGCPYYNQPGPVWPDGLIFDEATNEYRLRYADVNVFERKIMFIGMGPGNDEIALGKGFAGPAGQELWRLGEAVGLKREDAFITNLVKCLPLGVARDADHTLDPDAVKHCRVYLDKELDTCKANVTVPVGGVPLESLTKLEPIQKYRGAALLTRF